MPLLFIIFMIFVIVLFFFVLFDEINNVNNKYSNIKTIEDMKKLHWREFEKFIEFVFRKKGFKSVVRKWTHDWWIDIDAELDWKKYFIQCKKWNNYSIWRPKIQEFYWAVMAERKDALWIYITTSRLTLDAQNFAKKNNIEIWDNSNLEKHVLEFRSEFLISDNEKNSIDVLNSNSKVICTKCGCDMVKRVSHKWKYKWKEFYWCSNYPKCRNIKNIK